MHKIVVTEGCTCYGITYDDKDLHDYELDEVYDIARACFDKLNKDELVQFVWDYTTQHGDWKTLGHCDECGDDIDEFSVNI